MDKGEITAHIKFSDEGYRESPIILAEFFVLQVSKREEVNSKLLEFVARILVRMEADNHYRGAITAGCDNYNTSGMGADINTLLSEARNKSFSSARYSARKISIRILEREDIEDEQLVFIADIIERALKNENHDGAIINGGNKSNAVLAGQVNIQKKLGFSYRQMSDYLGIKMSTVKSILSRKGW